MLNNVIGIFLVFFIALVSFYFGNQFSIIGGPIFGIVFGMIFSFFRLSDKFRILKHISKHFLQISIILLGFGMNFYNVVSIGNQSIIIIIVTLFVSFIIAFFIGKYLKLSKNINILIGVGTSICGGSAIAATAPIINAEDKEIAYSISTIFLFNIVAVFIFPFFGHILKLSNIGFGMWAGTAINDTSSVVAAAYSYGKISGDFATVVKLVRTLMIIPITCFLSILFAKKFSFKKVFPWFILGFFATSIINTTISFKYSLFLFHFGKFVVDMAMVTVGLNINFKQFANNGIRPILLGFFCWGGIAVSSLICQKILHIF